MYGEALIAPSIWLVPRDRRNRELNRGHLPGVERTGHLDRREMAEIRGSHGFSLNTSRFKIAVTLTFGKSTTCAMLRSTATLTST